jgi:hypothetical protein
MKYVGEVGQQFRTRKQQHQCDVKNKIATNDFDNHLKHNRKHRSGTSLYRKKNQNESIYINALNVSAKHTKIMNLEK